MALPGRAWVLVGVLACAGCPTDGEGDASTTATSGGSSSTTGVAPSSSTGQTLPVTGSTSSEEGSSSDGTEPGTTTTSTDSSGGESTGEPSTQSLGCRSGRGLPEGETTFELSGDERRYILHLPSGYSGDQPYPLLLALHPNTTSIQWWNKTEGSRAIRSVVEDDAILVVPEDLTRVWSDDLPTELEYIDYIIEQMKTELCVDESRIFSMGFSGGGSFSGVLGCMRDDIRAIASGGSVIYFDPEDCINDPAAWVTIGEGELTDGRAAFRDFWRDTGGCEDTTMPTEPDPCVAYDGCAAQTPVHYCQHGGGHTWPSFGVEAAWAFLSQF